MLCRYTRVGTHGKRFESYLASTCQCTVIQRMVIHHGCMHIQLFVPVLPISVMNRRAGVQGLSHDRM